VIHESRLSQYCKELLVLTGIVNGLNMQSAVLNLKSMNFYKINQFQDEMRGIYFWPRLLLQASNRYWSILHTFVFLSAGFGYCILLGSYAFSRHHDLARTRTINTTNSSTQVKVCIIIIIHFPLGSKLEHGAPFGVSVITHTIRHTVGLLWTSGKYV
jgi:hypothetical protein